MGNQHEITKKQPLLKDNGMLSEEGWAKHLVLKYDRKKIHASWLRIKEWDYYAILDAKQKFGIAFTLSDVGYIGSISVTWFDFENMEFTQLDALSILPRGKTGFPSDSGDGIIEYQSKKLSIKFEYHLPNRHFTISAPKFKLPSGDIGLKADLTLYQDPEMETMVIATSWKENRKAFYYNQKINCMPCTGTVTIGEKEFIFKPESSFGVLDWGRGRWQYKNRWYWGSASGKLNGKSLGWNLGYGFSDRTPASENMIFYDGKAHKLDEVTFHIDPADYLKPWKFTSNDGRFEMDFQPILDRDSSINLFLIKTVPHQVFGYFTGFVILDDGTKLEINNFLGFAEDVINWW